MKKLIAWFSLAFLLMSAPVGAQNQFNLNVVCDDLTPAQRADAAACQGTEDVLGEEGVLYRIISALMFSIGVIAIIAFLAAALRLTLSGGDPNAITNARQALIYSLVGIVVAWSAFFIFNEFRNRVLDGTQVGASETTNPVDNPDMPGTL